MTNDKFTEAARAEAEQRWPEWPLGYAGDRLAFAAGAEWARTHLAAQEPTEAEVLAGALGELAYLQGYDLAKEEDREAVRSWWEEMSERVQSSRLSTARAALSAARAARRDEENR